MLPRYHGFSDSGLQNCSIVVQQLRYHVTSCSYLSSHHSYFRRGTQHLPLDTFSQRNARSDPKTHAAAQFDGVHVVSGSLDTSIRVWDVESGACRHALMGHQSLTSGMELRDNILVSGNADSTVKIWDILTGQCLQTLSGPNKHQSAVTCLQFNSKFVVTSSDDGTVKLWDVKTGDFIRDLVALESGGSGGVVWRIRSSPTKLVCAVGSRNGTEETKLMVLDFDAEAK